MSQAFSSSYNMTTAVPSLTDTEIPTAELEDEDFNDSEVPIKVVISDVKARLGFNTLGLGSALTAQGFKNIKPEPWAKSCKGSGSALALAAAFVCIK